jgi:hypothetical protein
MNTLSDLLIEVAEARQRFIKATAGFTYSQTQYKPEVNVWSVTENAEHLVWAEMSTINGLWRTVDHLRNNKPVWKGEAIHQGLPIETIIEKTWKEKEEAPEIVKPRWGGSLDYWIAALENCQLLLTQLSMQLEGFDLEQVIYPHIMSGPLNVIQRMQFLRFHLNRHQQQVERIIMP